MQLDRNDLSFAVTRLPYEHKKIMKEPEWIGKIFVGGGYIRAIVARETISDVDVFVHSKKEAELLAYRLADRKDIWKTDNAFTVKGKSLVIQIIHRWTFDKMEDVSNSFDFTICCAVLSYGASFLYKHDEAAEKSDAVKHIWDSYCDDRFYIDLAAKRLIYRKPIHNEDAGGSLLRVLKYYQRGYRIPLDSLAAVMTRMVDALDLKHNLIHNPDTRTEQTEKVLTGLLRQVDPNIDPTHEAHLPVVSKTMEDADVNLAAKNDKGDDLPW
jgi:hypothetical protein